MSYKNALLTKDYYAGGTINQNCLVKFDTAEETVVAATAATDLIIGVVDIANTEAGNSVVSGDVVDVIQVGIAEVVLGGNVTKGQLVTAGAAGVGVVAAPAAGVNNRVVGDALLSGVSGDIIPVQVIPHQIQGA